ncbi:MAG: bacteriorhodopsin [Verrucomicrobia bacterium]|jgi:bacteriorhodopsin|nr:bacteriorhodopsin [Verrucomicrobiota bacterium]
MYEFESTLQFLVNTTFNLAFMAMAGGAVYFIAMKNSVLPRYRSIMVVSGVILTIAALNYFYMKGWYADAVANGVDSFPTTFRYIDWLLTTPLMLVKFPLLLGLGKKGQAFMNKLIFFDIVMILSGFFGEITFGQPVLHYSLFGVGVVAWLVILYLLLSATQNLPERFSPVVRSCVKVMVLFVLLGWLIYPLGYILPSFGLPQDVRELVYNIGDIINKVGLAIVVYIAAVLLTKKEEEFDAS